MMRLGRLLAALSLVGLGWVAATVQGQDGGLLANGGFAQDTAEAPGGWVFEPAVGEATGRWRADGGVDNSACLEVAVTKAGQGDFRPAAGAVPLAAESAYLLTGSVKASNVAAGAHSIELQWFDEKGFLSRDAVGASAPDRWVTLALGPVAPPPGATRVHVLLRCYQEGTYAFDGLRLEPLPAPGKGRQVLRNGGCDSDGDGDGLPDSWVPAAGASGVLAWDGAVQQMGGHSVCIRRPAAASGPSPTWVQDGIPVTPALRYEFSAATRADAFGRDIRLAVEWLQGGKLIATAEMKDQTTEGWQRKTLRVLAPANAEQARVVLQSLSGGTVWFDSAALMEQQLAAQVDLWLEAPNARGMIRDGVDPRALRVRFAMETAEPGVVLRLALLDAAGKILAELRPDQGQGVWQPDIAALPLGAYRILAEAARADGGVVLSEVAPLNVVPANAPGLFFRADQVALLDGKPWFPIGVCSMPVLDPVAERLAAAGFNLIATGGFTHDTPEKVRETLERARALGLYLIEWNNGWAYEEIPFDVREQHFRTSAANVAGHPAFLGWMCDEAIWNGVPAAKVRNSYLAARAAAPTCVFWQNQAPRNRIEDLAAYVRWADVTGMDIYPVEGADHSDLPNKTLSVVGDEIEKQHRTTLPPTLLGDPAAPGRKPVWAILQGFGWSVWEKDPATHKRRPTWEETRFMAYDAILHGATGIVYWGASYEAQDSPIWDSLRRIARELADLSPALVATERVGVTVEGAPGVLAVGRRVDGKVWVIAANERGEAATASLRVEGVRGPFERVAEATPLAATDGSVSDAFAPFAVHVYRER
jgi:hypothetical protein